MKFWNDIWKSKKINNQTLINKSSVLSKKEDLQKKVISSITSACPIRSCRKGNTCHGLMYVTSLPLHPPITKCSNCTRSHMIIITNCQVPQDHVTTICDLLCQPIQKVNGKASWEGCKLWPPAEGTLLSLGTAWKSSLPICACLDLYSQNPCKHVA